MARPKAHLFLSQLKGQSHKNNWIKSVLSSGLKPGVKVLHEFSDGATDIQMSAAEIWCIAHYRLCGAQLTNGTDGGEGACGRIVSNATRAKLSQSSRGRHASKETRQKMSMSHKGRGRAPRTPEWCRKISESQKGKKLSPDHRAKISAALTGTVRYIPSIKTKEKISQSLKGRKATIEARINQSLAQTGKRRRSYKNNTSGAKGVYWSKGCCKWVAQVSINGKRKYLGIFASKQDAVDAVSGVICVDKSTSTS